MNKVPERLLRERIFSLMHDACFEWPKQNKYEYTCLSLGALINSSSFQSNNNTGIFYICIVVNQKLGIKKKNYKHTCTSAKTLTLGGMLTAAPLRSIHVANGMNDQSK